MKKLKAVIVDDEMHSLQTTELLIKQFCPEIEICALAETPEKGIAEINSLEPNVVFLDIAMPGMNGFELLTHLQHRNFEIIFTTAFDEYAIRAFKVNAIDYLLKPIEAEELTEAVKKVFRKCEDADYQHRIDEVIQKLNVPFTTNKIALPIDGKIRFLSPDEIIYCKSDGNYTELFLLSNQKLLISKTLKLVEQQINHPVFFRIHNSYLINLSHIKEYIRGEGGEIVMINGETLPVSRSKKDELLSIIYSDRK